MRPPRFARCLARVTWAAREMNGCRPRGAIPWPTHASRNSRGGKVALSIAPAFRDIAKAPPMPTAAPRGANAYDHAGKGLMPRLTSSPSAFLGGRRADAGMARDWLDRGPGP